jgi:hypothetical protein
MAAQQGPVRPKAFTPELWAQFLGGQAPLMQGLMGNYLEQSQARMFVQMQEQMPAGRHAVPRHARLSAHPGVDDHRSSRRGAWGRWRKSGHDPSSPPPRRRAPTVGFVSLGCPKALTDSELILTQLRAEGYAPARPSPAPTW